MSPIHNASGSLCMHTCRSEAETDYTNENNYHRVSSNDIIHDNNDNNNNDNNTFIT